MLDVNSLMELVVIQRIIPGEESGVIQISVMKFVLLVVVSKESVKQTNFPAVVTTQLLNLMISVNLFQ